MTVEEIRNLVELMKAQGVRRLKTDELELELADSALWAPPVEAQHELKEDIGITAGKPTEEELLFWSTPTFTPSTTQPPAAEKE